MSAGVERSTAFVGITVEEPDAEMGSCTKNSLSVSDESTEHPSRGKFRDGR